MGLLKLSWRYLVFHKYKSLIMIACIFLTAFLPIVIAILLNQFNEKIVSRADSTPAVIGAKGSKLDLTLHALYFKNKANNTIPYQTVNEIEQKGWAIPIPLYSNATAKDFPIVATSLDYFRFRNLQFDQGSDLNTLGDCVLGAAVAKTLDLKPGDVLLSDRESVLDIAGKYPLKMNVRGVLAPSRSPDDQAVFVDLKTAWIIEGLGHGHQDLSKEGEDSDSLLGTDGDTKIANASVLSYTEITESNIGSFHFHGDLGEFPISAIIAVAPDEKNETILQGYFDTANTPAQFAKPNRVVRELMGLVFQVKKFFDLNAILIAIATGMMLLLVVVLSLKLREREMQTMFKIGCDRGAVAMLQLYELGFIFVIAGSLVAGSVYWVSLYAGEWVQSLLIG